MKGGNVSRAAPLYPRLVMNGGASPFAVMEGGADAEAIRAVGNANPWPTNRPTPNPVAILDARINAAVNGFTAATSKPLDATLKGEIRLYSDNTNKALKDLTDRLQLLNDANKAFSQYRPGLGVDAGTMNAAKLQEMVDQIKEINERAEKASKKYTKLEEIAKTVEELAARGRGMGRNP
jgi:methyl-accepting chemotaxis protein